MHLLCNVNVTRISQTGAIIPEMLINLLFRKIFAENCMENERNRTPRGVPDVSLGSANGYAIFEYNHGLFLKESEFNVESHHSCVQKPELCP